MLAMIRQLLFLNLSDVYLWSIAVLALILLSIAIYAPELYRRAYPVLIKAAKALLVLLVSFATSRREGSDATNLEEAIEAAGYAYDLAQDIFYSRLDAWQRKMGYCRLYDEAAAPMGMIIDCEPVYFEYAGRRWMIELWKGQYDLTTGCEIGVYWTDQPDIEVPNVYKGPFFRCAEDEDLLHMTYLIKKNGVELYGRDDKHWWLTGFKLGEFSEPWELCMELTIAFKDEAMRDAFLGGLRNIGYNEDEIIINDNSVSMVFDKPRTQQPFTRTADTDWIIQRKNRLMCEKYQEITGPYYTFPEKLKAVQEQSPELTEWIMSIGKSKGLYESFETLKAYILE